MASNQQSNWMANLTDAFQKTQATESTKQFYQRFPMGSIWGWNQENIMNPLIFSELTPSEKNHAIQRTELFAVNAIDVESQKLSYQHWDKYFNQRFGDWKQKSGGLQETPHYRPDLTFEVAGSRYSLDFLKKLNIALEVIERFQVGAGSRVLELGSGFGQVGRILHHLKPGFQYVAVDLPESLYFAAIFLNLTCPDAKIVWIKSPEELPGTLALTGAERPDMILIPCVFADHLAATKAEADVFINTSSLGEMNNASSQYYLETIQKHLRVKHAFLLNRLLNTYDRNIEPDRAQESGWYFSLDGNWKVINWELEPIFTRIPHAEMFHNRELLWIASRTAEKAAATIPSDILKQAWFEGFTVRAAVRHANQLVFETGKDSVVCQLCEAARISPNEKNLDALIKYLSAIRKAYPFEEMPLLYGKYRQAAGSKHFTQKSKFGVNLIFSLITILGLRRLGVSCARRLPPSLKNALYKMFYNEPLSLTTSVREK